MISGTGSHVAEFPPTTSKDILNPECNINRQDQVLSYSHVTQKVIFPKKEQAIVLDVIEEISIKEYILAAGNIVKPNNLDLLLVFPIIVSASTLLMSLLFNLLVKTNVNIKGHVITIRPLILESKRVLLSNVCPIIPHDVINKLTDLGIK
ncbi:hypothetical protein P5V15_005026 [Pogonomyrmex californicus]